MDFTKTLTRWACLATLAAVPLLQGQTWEVGGAAGAGYYRDARVTSPAGEGNVGIKTGPAISAILGANMYEYIGGEVRYTYQRGELRVRGNGQEATMAGDAHAIHYDFLFHFARRDAAVRPFVLAGGGMKIYRGIGEEVAAQPLNRLALPTKTTDVRGLGTFGGGVKIRISQGAMLRFEVRDYLTLFPKKAIAPSIGADIGDLLHGLVFMGGITFLF